MATTLLLPLVERRLNPVIPATATLQCTCMHSVRASLRAQHGAWQRCALHAWRMHPSTCPPFSFLSSPRFRECVVCRVLLMCVPMLCTVCAYRCVERTGVRRRGRTRSGLDLQGMRAYKGCPPTRNVCTYVTPSRAPKRSPLTHPSHSSTWSLMRGVLCIHLPRVQQPETGPATRNRTW